MVILYYTLIVKKRRTINDIPDKFRSDVLEMLRVNNYDENGDILKNVEDETSL